MNENTKKGAIFGVFAVIGYLLMSFYRTTQENNALKVSLMNKPQSETAEESGGGGGGGGYMPHMESPVVVVPVPLYGRNYGRLAARNLGPNAPKMKVVDRKVKIYAIPAETLATTSIGQTPAAPTSPAANATTANLMPTTSTVKPVVANAVQSTNTNAANLVQQNDVGFLYDCGCGQ
jgi:carbohydrate-binding DOMON domain-containing protein